MNPEQLLKLGSTIVTVTVGSRLFGTERQDSDHDFIHIYKPHLNRLILGQNDQPSQEKVEHPNGAKHEHTYWSLQHFFKLLGQGQTQALEIAFAPPTCWHAGEPGKNPSHKYWTDFRAHFHKNKSQWISKNTAAFVGYCKSQANKYSVKGERLEAVNYLIDGLKHAVTAWGFSQHSKLVDAYQIIEQIKSASRAYLSIDLIDSQGTAIEHINCCNVKCPVHFTINQALVMYTTLRQQYGRRAEEARGNGDIDWKALSHAARVTIEAKELLTTTNITLPLKGHDREYVRNIKAGLVPHSEVIEFLDTGLSEIEELREKSVLRESVDKDLYNSWIIQAYAGEKVA